MIQTLVLGRRNPGKFRYQCFSLSRVAGGVERTQTACRPMWGPAPWGSGVQAASSLAGGAGTAGASVAAVGCAEACHGGMINEQPHQLRLTFREPSRTSAELSAL